MLVIVTLGGALSVYRHVARESPHGEGSIAMLERLFPQWRGKLFVLVLLGFAATDFLITMTLSAADATAHLVENPFMPEALHGHNIGITLLLLAVWFVYVSVRRLIDPPDVSGPLVLFTALAGIVINIAAAWSISRANRTSLNVEGAFQHRAPTCFKSAS